MHARIRKIRSRRRLKRLVQFHRFRRDERGIQLVELSIVIPIFLLLFAATAEFGRYFYEYTTLAKAARVGARYLSTAQVLAAEDTTAKNIVVYGNPNGTGSPILKDLAPSNIVITRAGGTPILPQTVTVAVVGYKHSPLFDLGLLTKTAGLSLNVDVKPSVTMRYLLTQPPPIP
jgi:Flp pilus assembly protein TadG